jgi:hypothetical protein
VSVPLPTSNNPSTHPPSLITRSPVLRHVVSITTKGPGKRKRAPAENDIQRLTMPLTTNALPVTPLTASLPPSAHSTHPAPLPQTHSALAVARASPPAPAAPAHACSSPTCSQSATIISYDKEKKNSLFLRHSVRLAYHAHVLRIRARPPAGVRLGSIVLSVRRQMACLCVARRRRKRHTWGRRPHV